MTLTTGNKTGRTGTDWRAFLGYGSGDFALNLFWQGTGFYLFFFFTNVLGLPGATVGTIFLVASIWDAVSDPMMGYLAERGRGRWGQYRTYLTVGAIPLSASFIFLFTPLDGFDSAAREAFAFVALILFRTAYTVVSIPYSALSARVTQDFDGRTRLAGIRMYFGFLGGVCISFLAKYLQEVYPDAQAFHYMSIGAGLVAVVVLLASAALTRETVPKRTRGDILPNLWARLTAMAYNGPFLLIAACITLVTVATAITGQTMLYFFESLFGDRGAGNTAIIVMGAAPLVTIPVWSFVALRIGKRRAWTLGGLIAAGGCGLLYLSVGQSVAAALASVVVLVTGLSAYAILFWSMLPDTIEYGHYKSGIRSESFLIGVASSFQKVSIGFSAFLAGALLDLVGFVPGQPVAAHTAEGIRSIISLIPMVALVASSLIMFFYPVTAQSHTDMLTKLKGMEGGETL